MTNSAHRRAGALHQLGISHTRRQIASPRHEQDHIHVQEFETLEKVRIRDIGDSHRLACADGKVIWA